MRKGSLYAVSQYTNRMGYYKSIGWRSITAKESKNAYNMSCGRVRMNVQEVHPGRRVLHILLAHGAHSGVHLAAGVLKLRRGDRLRLPQDHFLQGTTLKSNN